VYKDLQATRKSAQIYRLACECLIVDFFASLKSLAGRVVWRTTLLRMPQHGRFDSNGKPRVVKLISASLGSVVAKKGLLLRNPQFSLAC
jgi:hypothetical protein